jgi:hypothetical protein
MLALLYQYIRPYAKAIQAEKCHAEKSECETHDSRLYFRMELSLRNAESLYIFI